MSDQASELSLARLGKLREVLDLIGAIRDIADPLGSADGLRQAIDSLIKFGRLVGIDPTWTDRLASILSDPGIFRIVEAVIRYATGASAKEIDNHSISVCAMAADGPHELTVSQRSFTDWLPVVIQIISLLRQIRSHSRAVPVDAAS